MKNLQPSLKAPKVAVEVPVGASTSNEQIRFKAIKRLIWLYFWLIVFEGALRKWFLVPLSAPLLFIRDPVLLTIYFLAARARVFPLNKTVLAGGAIAIACFIAGFIAMPDTPLVAFFGLRANFLHLPLIFIIGKVFEPADVKKVGYAALILAIPLSLIMAAQFRAPASSWLNTGAGEGAGQIASAGGHVRASATFSYILGPIYFYALVAIFLIESQIGKYSYPKWLIWATTLALALAAATSGSRTFVLTLGIMMFAVVLTGVFLRPALIPKIAKICFGLFVATLILSQTSVFNEALDIFNARVDNASASEGGTGGIVQSRILEDFTRPLEIIPEVPPLGYGLGSGTIVGSVLLGGKQGFTYGRDSERELTRNVLESGPALGLTFVAFRFYLFFSFLFMSVKHARRGNIMPLLCFSVSGLLLLNGQLAQTTLQGFAVFISGLCLAAMNVTYRPVSKSAVGRPSLSRAYSV